MGIYILLEACHVFIRRNVAGHFGADSAFALCALLTDFQSFSEMHRLQRQHLAASEASSATLKGRA